MIMIADIHDIPLDLAAHEMAVADAGAGAVVSFQGVVRDHDEQRGVGQLSLTGAPTSDRYLEGRRCHSWRVVSLGFAIPC